jgi:hypothetical protein
VRLSAEFANGEDIWFQFRQTVQGSPPFVPDHAEGFSHCHIMQWHTAPGVTGTSPILSFHLTDDGAFQIKTRGDNVQGRSGSPFLVQYQDDDFEFGREYGYRLHVVFSPTGGVLEVERDGVEIFAGTPVMSYPDNPGSYPKFGIYRTTTLGSLVVLTKLDYLGDSDPG